MLAGAGLAGAAASALPGPAAAPIAGAAAIIGAAWAEAEAGRGRLVGRVAACALGAAAFALLAAAGRHDAGLACFAGAAALALAWGSRGWRLVAGLSAGAALLAAARVAQLSVAEAELFAAAPAPLWAGAGGVAFAAVAVFALVPRHLELRRDRVGAAAAALGGQVGGELAELCARGQGLWKRAAAELDDSDPNRALLEEAVVRLLDTARRWSAAAAEASPELADSLAARMEKLAARADAADDAEAAAQYREARAALGEQLGYLRGISHSRERVVARMHNYLATMERLHLAVVNLRSQSASRSAGELSPIVASLESIGADIASCAEALEDAS